MANNRSCRQSVLNWIVFTKEWWRLPNSSSAGICEENLEMPFVLYVRARIFHHRKFRLRSFLSRCELQETTRVIIERCASFRRQCTLMISVLAYVFIRKMNNHAQCNGEICWWCTRFWAYNVVLSRRANLCCRWTHNAWMMMINWWMYRTITFVCAYIVYIAYCELCWHV